MQKLFRSVIVILTVTIIYSQPDRGIKIKTSDGHTLPLYNRSYALVIGISHYQNWRDLPNAVKDADAVAAELQKLGFKVTKLTDNTSLKPTKRNIIKALNNLQYKSADDRIIIYYAGHGNSVPIPYQEGYYNGYIIPADAERGNISTYISMSNIKDITIMYNAKHVLYLFDSCFSGHFVDITRSDHEPESTITEKITQPVRQVISAGTAEQEASDGVYHSPFCEVLLDNLQNMTGDYNSDGYLTGEELSFNIRQKVANETRGDQTPESGKMKGFKQGDFVFTNPNKRVTKRREVAVETEYAYGKIRVESNAEGSVYLDNSYVCGISPGGIKILQNIRTGSHQVKIETDDKTKNKPVMVIKNSASAVSFHFPSKISVPENMVYVEGGSFQMGSDAGDGDEQPVHTVRVNDFYMSKYEVTHAEYIEFLNSRGVSGNGSYNGNELIDMDDGYCAIGYRGGEFYFKGSSKADKSNCPLIEVTWYGAVEYCNWLSDQAGLTKVYTIYIGAVDCDWDANGYRLPTEAEWEYAARGGNKSRGYRYSGSNTIDEVAWHDGNSGDETHPVGQKRPNELGIHDMSGNVWEWCWDWYDSDYYSESPTNNPTGPSSGSYRVLRGGGWHSNAGYCRAATRSHINPTIGSTYSGFRFLRTK